MEKLEGIDCRMKRPHVVMAVDDNMQNVELLDGILSSRGYTVVKAHTGMEALTRVVEVWPDVILLDVLMPGMDGYEVCRRLKENESTRLIPVIMITALNSLEDKVRGIEAGADDFLAKPIQKPELVARVKSLVRLKGLLDELENAQHMLFSLATVLDCNDPYTCGHSRRVAEYGQKLAHHIGLSEDEQKNINHSGLLHDLGKVAVDKAVLHKHGVLTNEEYDHIKQHPVIGEKICEPLNFAKPFLNIIRNHHEKFNGAGYPDGLAGKEISLGCRIIGVVDAYDALVTLRPYRPGMLPQAALGILKEETAKEYWDREIVHAFCDMIESENRAAPRFSASA